MKKKKIHSQAAGAEAFLQTEDLFYMFPQRRWFSIAISSFTILTLMVLGSLILLHVSPL